MRVLSIIHGPVYGGGHTQLIRLAEPLAERGWDTIALAPTEPGNALARLRDAGIDTIALPLHRLRATTDPRPHAGLLASMPKEIAALRSIIRDRSVDVVQVHGPTNPHGAVAARREGAAVAWQLDDTRTPMVVRRLTMPGVVRLADVITTFGDELARAHPGARRLGERCVTVFPPVDTARFAPDSGRRRAARAELGLADEVVAVGTVGNLNPSKGHEHLIAALRIVRHTYPNATLRVLGASGEAHASYEAGLQAAVAEVFGEEAGVILRDPGARVADLLPAFDIFALASVPRSEGMPTAILEAMAAGLPVVATDVGAVRELVDDGESGLVVAPESPSQLASALTRLVDGAARRGAMGARGRAVAIERFDVGRLADRHAEAYAAALRHRDARMRC